MASGDVGTPSQQSIASQDCSDVVLVEEHAGPAILDRLKSPAPPNATTGLPAASASIRSA